MIAAAASVAFLVSLVTTPLVRRLAILCGATDMPDARRVHLRPTPRGGGLAVALAAFIALALATDPSSHLMYPLAGALFLLVVGIVDDLRSLRAEIKLVAQVIAAVLAVAGGLRFDLFGAEPGLVLGLVDAAVTVVWIVLITNAFNLADGLDGLASGLGVISFVALAAAGLHAGDLGAATPPLVLTAALLGFLPYNFNPATIFLGDTGSLLIGYAISVLALHGPGGTALPPLAAFLLVAIPATDTFLAIARRFLSRSLRAWGEGDFWGGITGGLRNMVSPDRRHIHHRLIDLGFSHRRAVILIYIAAASTAALAYLELGSKSWPMDLFALGLASAVIALVQALGIDELRPAHSGLFLPVVRRLARHRRLIVHADLGLAAAAYLSALVLTGTGHGLDMAAAGAVGVMAGIQLIVFARLAVYRTAWWATGMSGFGLLVRTCVIGAAGGYVALRLLGLPASVGSGIVYFALLLPAVTLMRFAQLMLTHARNADESIERTLICGTDTEGRNALLRTRRNGLRRLDPIGFIEVRPRWQGRQLGRLPVLGTLEGLEAILHQEQIRHLIIADPRLSDESLDWVRAVCRQRGVQLHHYVEKFVTYDTLAPAVAAANGNGASLIKGNGAAAHGNGANGDGDGTTANGNGNGATILNNVVSITSGSGASSPWEPSSPTLGGSRSR